MRDLNRVMMLLAILALIVSSCKEDVEEKQVYDNIIYQVDTQRIYSSSAEKVKQKSQSQYISIMYSDLFNKNISRFVQDLFIPFAVSAPFQIFNIAGQHVR